MSKNNEKHPGGRPKTTVEEKLAQKTFNLKTIEKLGFYGLTDQDLAVLLEVDEATINRWKNEPEFLQALKKGKQIADNKVIKRLYERAMGYEHKDLFITQYQGQIVSEEITKHYPPDTAAAFIWLKNRQGWRDKKELEHSGNINNTPKFDLTQLKPDELVALDNMLDKIRATKQAAREGIIANTDK